MRHTYTDKEMKWIQANLKKVGYIGAAKRLGVSIEAMKVRVTLWRKAGQEMPSMRREEVGTKTIRSEKGVLYQYEKIGKGKWNRINRITPPAERIKREPVAKIPKPPKPPKVRKVKIEAPRKLPKPEVVRLPTLVIDMAGKHYVKRDNRTWVLKRIA